MNLLGANAAANLPPPAWTFDAMPPWLSRIQRLRVLFAHQALGESLICGAVQASEGWIETTELSSTDPLDPGTWSHVRVGQDGDAFSKLAHLQELAEGGFADQVDVVLFKLGTNDVLPGSEPVRLLDAMVRTFERIQRSHGVRVVPMTVPLTAPERGASAWLKRARHKRTGRAEANEAREALNALLRDVFEGQPLFDLAALESRGITDGGAPALDPDLSDDGHDLNARGRERVGEALVRFAATLPLRTEA